LSPSPFRWIEPVTGRLARAGAASGDSLNAETWRHEMNCPACNVALVMTERQGTEIDYCPKCRGVWLDRGELDKIIEKSLAAEAPRATGGGERGYDRDRERPRADYPQGDRHRDDRHRDDRDHGGRPYRKKKESFLSELFDF
jgi:Zn-finger nucleic acid-binding protein